MENYIQRLKTYIQTKACSRDLYSLLSLRLRGDDGRLLRRMAHEEAAHLKALQLEYYLLCGDTLPTGKHRFEASAAECLRRACADEWESAQRFSREANDQSDPGLKKLYSRLSRDALRHRSALKRMLGHITGMSG